MVFQIPTILKWYLNTSDSEHSWSALVARISVRSLCAHPGTRARVAFWRHAVSPPRNLGGRETIITSCRPAITWPFSLPGVPGKPTVFGGVKNIRPSPCRYSVNIAASFPVESDEVRPTLRISLLRVSKPRLLPGQCRLLLGQTLRIFWPTYSRRMLACNDAFNSHPTLVLVKEKILKIWRNFASFIKQLILSATHQWTHLVYDRWMI